MKRRKFLSGLCISLILATQPLMVGVATANEPSPSPTESPEVQVSPSPSPEPTTTAPETSPSPSPVTASPSPEPTPWHKGDGSAASWKDHQAQKNEHPATETGPDAPTGTVPEWVYDTTARKWVAADASSFMYDKASGYWLSPKYYYDKQNGWYKIVPSTGTVTETMITAPKVVHTSMGDLVVGSGEYQLAQMMGIIGPDGQPTGAAAVDIANTGAGSTNQGSIANNNQSWMDLTNLVNVINTLQSNAKSGDVSATSNTQAGDAITGTATVIANLINLLASAWSWSSGDLAFFMESIGTGESRFGDVLLQPAAQTGGGGQLGGSATTSNTGAGSDNTATVTNENGLNVRAQDTGSITNNVDLAAQSGSAVASKNTEVGNVRTGNAVAEVNILNLINSFINSGNSFFGILNIFGSLNGDILFPDGFLNGLFGGGNKGTAANGQTGPGSVNSATINDTNQSTVSNTADNRINNNVQASANSGDANVISNTQAGSARTGEAKTTDNLFNLANSSIFGDNAVLVIVNVMGRWVGRIMSLPGGSSSSALLTGNAQVSNNETGPGSVNTAAVANTNTADIDQKSYGTITNNVTLDAQSGDATAAKNTQVGDVETGSAHAVSSVANIVNSALNVRNWFGVLVINVFGDWFGSVNEDTEAGEAPVKASAVQAEQAVAPQNVPAAVVTSSGGATTPAQHVAALSSGIVGATLGAATMSSGAGGVLTAAAHTAGPAATAASHSRDMSLLFLISAGLLLVAGAMFSIERKLKTRP